MRRDRIVRDPAAAAGKRARRVYGRSRRGGRPAEERRAEEFPSPPERREDADSAEGREREGGDCGALAVGRDGEETGRDGVDTTGREGAGCGLT
jgi:hypothetical protein